MNYKCVFIKLVLLFCYMTCYSEASLNSHRFQPTSTESRGCDHDKLTVYKIILKTVWDRKVFPKQYPEWRPPAQWSRTIGRSHSPSYTLFHIGSLASDGVRVMAESGKTEAQQEAEAQGDGGVLDGFGAPPISSGVGKVDTEFFVDGNHSRVSFMTRLVPSPDWFIGLDSFDMCVHGTWIDSVAVELEPLDAGTDNGFTFTSPNWPTVPPKPISRITATTPQHPANSFFYPDRFEHPPIATVTLIKVKEYELSRVFNISPPSSPTVVVTRKQISNEVLPPNPNAIEPDTAKSDLIKNLVKKYKQKMRNNKRKGRKGRRHRKPRDCRISEWGEWAPCSKSCGIGEQVRERKVLKHSRRGGRHCPPLKEQKWCGSSRDCAHKYFNW